MTTVKNLYDFIHSFAPFDTQEAWDNSGFLIGDFKKQVQTCVVTLDVTIETVRFAQEHEAQLILSHHPVIFSKLTSVLSGSLVYTLIHNGIAVLSAHTNYDIAPGGINDALAETLGLQNVVASAEGCLRIGELEQPIDAHALALRVKDKLSVSALRFTDSTKPIRRVALCGGAGADFISIAQQEADAYVTGDASYHNLLDAQQAGFCLIAAGHYETEQPGIFALRERLKSLFTDVVFLDPYQENPIKTL